MRPARFLPLCLSLAGAVWADETVPGGSGGAVPGGSDPTALAAGSVVAPVSPVLTLDPERLFAGSAWGRRAQADIEKASVALAAENRGIEAGLMAEERALTERRKSMTPEAFRAEADAFDARVVTIRQTQDGKARRLARLGDAERQNFFGAAIPVMGRVMQDRGAVAVLDARTIFLSASTIDITDDMIGRIDAAVGAGAPPDPASLAVEDGGGEPSPVPAPAPAPGAGPSPAPAP